MTHRQRIPIVIDDETRPLWEAAQRAAAEVAAWPAWKHNESSRTDHDDDALTAHTAQPR